MRRIRVGILFGGQSAEHEVSIQSARNVFEAIDKIKYEPVLIGISKKGQWIALSPEQFRSITSHSYQALPEKSDSKNINIPKAAQYDVVSGIDVVFPILHGPNGEDGTVQGMLKLMNIPFVGASVLGSAVGMDKDVMKRLLRDAGLPVVRFKTLSSSERISFQKITREFGTPLFVKPANLGSSIGVSKVRTKQEFVAALDKAFAYDRKILIEQGIDAREVECSVLGNEEKIASLPGEILPTHEFYDYEAKYIDENGAILQIPATLPKKKIKEIQEAAIQACRVLCVEGMARVDFFIEKQTNKLYVNEINTIPGFTNISMYPKLWEASGLPYSVLIDRLITLAIERHEKEQTLKGTYKI